jgi:hypothetical protein
MNEDTGKLFDTPIEAIESEKCNNQNLIDQIITKMKNKTLTIAWAILMVDIIVIVSLILFCIYVVFPDFSR